MSEQIGQYQLLAPIASGGMAEVWFAQRIGVAGFARDVVVKKMHKRLAHDDDYVRMFLDEARLTATLQHPNIAQVIDLGRANDTWFIAMEFVDGPDLGRAVSHVIRQGRQMPVDLSTWVVARAARGLHYAHRQVDPMTGVPLGLIHRDVSHANMLLSRHGDVKVIDFGIAQAKDRHAVTQAGVVKGKPGYLSPEQIRGEPLSPRVDVFSLGVVLWELLTGKVLFRQAEHLASMERTLEYMPPPPSQLRPGVSPDLDSVVLAALEKSPVQRLSDASELSSLLDDCLGDDDKVNAGYLAKWVRDEMREIWPPKELRALQSNRTQSMVSQIPGMVDAAKLAAERISPKREPTSPRAGERTRRGAAVSMESLRVPTPEVPTEPEGRVITDKAKDKGPRDNLVRDLTPIIGRRDVLQRLSNALSGGGRMLTLTGEAGVGKSRLAAAFSLAAAPRFAADGGSWRCSLTACEDIDDVCREVAMTLGVQLGDADTAEKSAAAIGKALAGRGATLLWLDDAGKRRTDVALLAQQWLKSSARLLLLATSRRALGVRGEKAIDVPPLSFEAGLKSPAAALLHHCIRQANKAPEALLSDEKEVLAVLAETCGLPMAIELAAARIVREGKVSHTKTNPGFLPLTTALREAWTQLLTWEQASLLQACAFPGGFDEESLSAVLSERGFDDRKAAAAAVISNLSERSLLKPVSGESGRFIVHDNIRSWIKREGLEATALLQELNKRQQAWALNIAEGCARELRGHNGHAAREKISSELSNLLAVYRRVVGDDGQWCLRFSVALGQYLLERGPLGLLGSLLKQAIGERGDEPDEHLAWGLTLQAEVMTRTGAPSKGLKAAQRAQEIAEKLGAKRVEAYAWLRIGECYRRLDKNSRAMRAAIQARQVADTLDDMELQTEAVHLFGCLYFDLGDKAPARRCFEASQAGAQRSGDHHLAARAQANLGCILADVGELDEAEQMFIVALDKEQQLGNLRGAALCSCYLALVAQERGDFERTDRLFAQAVRWLEEVGDHFRRAYVVGFQGWSLLEQGRWDEADELLSLTVAFFLEKGDRKLRTMHLAFHALCLTRIELDDEATESLTCANNELDGLDEPAVHAVVKLMKLCCLGDKDPILAAAEAEARAPRPPLNAPRPSLAATSAEVRFALRLVERWGP